MAILSTFDPQTTPNPHLLPIKELISLLSLLANNIPLAQDPSLTQLCLEKIELNGKRCRLLYERSEQQGNRCLPGC